MSLKYLQSYFDPLYECDDFGVSLYSATYALSYVVAESV